MFGLLFSCIIIIFGLLQNTRSQQGQALCSSQPDGLYANYTNGCKTYYRCENNALVKSTACPLGTAFDISSNSCQAQYHCVMPYCSMGDYSLYVVPHSRCKRYYQCQGDGRITEKICPFGTIFSSNYEKCIQDDGKCAEPTCVGRSDGVYADYTTQNCKRAFRCRKNVLKELFACPFGQGFDGKHCVLASTLKCRIQEESALATSISGFRCISNLCDDKCFGKADGFYKVDGSFCKKYYYCSDGKISNSGTCSENTVFNGQLCVSASLYTCLEYYQNQCKSKSDGNYRDYSDCQSYYTCQKGAFHFRGRCSNNMVWSDEGHCVPNALGLCSGPETWPMCSTVPEGLYQNHSAESGCRSYFHCFRNGLRTHLTCPGDRLFDGASCVPSSVYSCPTQHSNTCLYKQDGYYQERESGCKSYYYCSANNKITYVCPERHIFNGRDCVSEQIYSCPYGSEDCKNLSDGYYSDKKTKCRDYYYCLNNKRITTLTCSDNRIFNGERCVQSTEFACPGVSLPQAEICNDKEDGFHADTTSACTKYYRCLRGKLKAQHTCSRGYVYDGQSSCVPNKCTQNKDCKRNGFFTDFDSQCHDYYFCIDGKKTVLKCPGDRVFNGQLCVPKHTFSCQSDCDRIRIKNGCDNNL